METINLGIFSSSKDVIKEILPTLTQIANHLRLDYKLHYGGGDSGLMGFIPSIFSERGGKVIGHNIKLFSDTEAFGEEIIYETFSERQSQLINKSNVILVLPGGVGTMSELFDVLVRNDLNLWDDIKSRRVILLNFNKLFQPIHDFLIQANKLGLVKNTVLNDLYLANSADECLQLINQTIV